MQNLRLPQYIPSSPRVNTWGKANWFSLLNLNPVYLKIPLDDESKRSASFGQYEYNILLFGLASGFLSLNRLIVKIFGNIKCKYYFLFSTIYIPMEPSTPIYGWLMRLHKAGLTVNQAKLILASDSIKFLGHVFKNQSVALHPNRIRPITDSPPPPRTNDLFLGLGSHLFKIHRELCTDITRIN